MGSCPRFYELEQVMNSFPHEKNERMQFECSPQDVVFKLRVKILSENSPRFSIEMDGSFPAMNDRNHATLGCLDSRFTALAWELLAIASSLMVWEPSSEEFRHVRHVSAFEESCVISGWHPFKLMDGNGNHPFYPSIYLSDIRKKYIDDYQLTYPFTHPFNPSIQVLG